MAESSRNTAAREPLQTLLRTVRAEDLQTACEAVREIALRGDRSVLPQLHQAREEVRAELNAGDRLVDASEERRDMALTMAIITLLTPAECEKLLQSGDEFEKSLIRRKQTVTSPREFWEPTTG